MGASCSSTAISRYNYIKKRLLQKECLTFHSADGLLPQMDGNGPPIWLFGEDHGENESDTLPKDKRNCVLISDLLKQAVSNCSSNEADVVLIYENAVISKNDFFFKEDVNDIEITDEYHHDVRFVRKAVKDHANKYKNIKVVYMDVFGRIRMLKAGVLEGPLDTNIILNHIRMELQEFWKTSGRYSELDSINKASSLAMSAMPMAGMLQNTIMNRSRYWRQGDEFMIYVTCMCVIISKMVLLSSNNNEKLIFERSYKKIISEIDEKIFELSTDTFKIHPDLQKFVDRGDLTQEDAMFTMFDTLLFEIITMAGDLILHEHITNISPKNIIVMHAGHVHSNNQRRWLLNSTHVSDIEKVSPIALKDNSFIESRNI